MPCKPLIKNIFFITLALCFLNPLITFSQTKEKTSAELIFSAYKNKEISYNDYLFYEVQSIFAPDKLPAKYRVIQPAQLRHDVTLLLRDVKLNWENFSEEQKKFLKNIFGRPTDNPDPGGDSYTVSETTPHSTTHFKIHYVLTTTDAPPLTDTNPANGIPDYVEFMGQEFETVYNIENGSEPSGLGYSVPPSDGTAGGDEKFDVYIKDIGGDNLYGYCAPETQVSSNPVKYTSYCVLDDDYSAAQFPQYGGDYTKPLRVTAAHEYHHAVQFGYFTNGPTWFFESTAAWVEDEVYDNINDNYQYLTGYFNYPYMSIDWIEADNAPDNGYRDWIFLRYISEKYGRNIIRKFWEIAGTSCTSTSGETPANRLCTLNAIDTILQQKLLITTF